MAQSNDTVAVLLQSLADDDEAVNNHIWVAQSLALHEPFMTVNAGGAPLVKKWGRRLCELLQADRLSTRWTAIGLVNATVKSSKPITFDGLWQQWIPLLVAMMRSADPPEFLGQVGVTFSTVISWGSQQGNSGRDVIEMQINRFVMKVLNELSVPSCIELQCNLFDALTRLVQSLPRQMKANTEKIASAALSVVECKSRRLRRHAAFCLASLPLCGKTSAQRSERWTALANEIVESMHLCLDQSFSCVVEDTHRVRATQSLSLPPLGATSPADDAGRHAHRFSCLAEVFCTAVSQCPGTATLLQPDIPLAVVDRVLSIGSHTPPQPSSKTEHRMLMVLLPTYKTSVLSVLAVLLQRGRQKLAPMAAQISTLLIRELRLVEEQSNHSEISRQVLDTVVIAFETVGLWLSSQLVEVALDCALKIVETHISSDQARTDIASGRATCWMAAAKVLNCALGMSSSTIPGEKVSAIEKTFCLLILTYQTGFASSPNLLADFSQCRLAAYHVLITCLLTPANQRPLVRQSFQIISRGVDDPNLEISIGCRRALLSLSLLIHPRLPCHASMPEKPMNSMQDTSQLVNLNFQLDPPTATRSPPWPRVIDAESQLDHSTPLTASLVQQNALPGQSVLAESGSHDDGRKRQRRDSGSEGGSMKKVFQKMTNDVIGSACENGDNLSGGGGRGGQSSGTGSGVERGETERERETERETKGETERETERETKGESGRDKKGETERETKGESGRDKKGETERETKGERDMQAVEISKIPEGDVVSKLQTNTQADTQTDTDTFASPPLPPLDREGSTALPKSEPSSEPPKGEIATANGASLEPRDPVPFSSDESEDEVLPEIVMGPPDDSEEI